MSDTPKTAQQILEIPSQEELQEQPVEQVQEPEVQEPVQEAQPKESVQAKNFAALRQQKELAERERDEAIRILKEMESKKAPEVDEEIVLGPDDLAEGKHLSKVQQKIKKLEQQLKNYERQSVESNIETKLKVQYPDFDSVVSRENIDSLRSNYPEIAATINSSPDLYSKAVSAYTLIKKLGITPDTSYDMDKVKIQQNVAKPKPLASISPQRGDSPLSRANAFAEGKLSKELSEQLFKEMNEARKGY